MVVIRVATSASTKPTSTATTYCTRTSLSTRRASKRLHHAPSTATEHHKSGDNEHDQCHAEELARLGGRLGIGAPYFGIPLSGNRPGSRPLCTQVTHVTPFAHRVSHSVR